MRKSRAAWWVPVALAGLYGCWMEKGLIFFPTREMTITPAYVGLRFEDLYLKTSDGIRVNAWFIPHPEARASLLWLHGNGGNLSHRVDQLRWLHEWVPAHVLMLDYREYGRSEGTVTEEGTYRDAEAAYDHLVSRPESASGRVVVFGQSLGSAVAVELSLRRRVDGLILEAPLISIREMARTVFPWFPGTGWLKTRYDTLSKIGKVKAPLLILHGDRDEIVPFEHGERLYGAANEPKRFYTIRGSGHNDTYIVGGRPYFEEMARFIRELPKG
jgi:fermentation-respiration switch protein FrsA (DUF1100 family)